MSQHEAISKISPFIGKWLGVNGRGIYPTIKSFDYKEELDIQHLAPNQPVLLFKYV